MSFGQVINNVPLIQRVRYIKRHRRGLKCVIHHRSSSLLDHRAGGAVLNDSYSENDHDFIA